MFETAELGRSITRDEFAARQPDLQTALLAAQRALAQADFPVIIIVGGVEGAGKGEVVSRLHEWLDVRFLETSTFLDSTDEERERPWFWRFWRKLPARGRIGVMFGSWYTQPIVERVLKQSRRAEFDQDLHRICEFEQLLTDDGALLIKLWFHISDREQKQRLKADRRGNDTRVTPMTKSYSRHYRRFWKASERAIRTTDHGTCPWHVIEATEARFRDITAGQTILDALQRRLAATPDPAPAAVAAAPEIPADPVTILDKVDLSQRMSGTDYEAQLDRWQDRLYALAWELYRQRRHCVAVFEGWDAAGKGGTIRRITKAMDARLYRAISIAAPTDEERAHHYLWRFWRQIPRAGQMTIYDRSWYGRVLVERVEGFAQTHEWRRAYQEINDFEEQLCDNRAVLMKFWLHIDQDEQARRFEERQTIPWKQHKISADDWRNRKRWREYEAAVDEMIARTSTVPAPWTIVAANDKKSARVQVLKTFCERIENALG